MTMALSFHNGDRICVRTVDDDGLPIVRYGTVGGELPSNGPIVVMFDDLLGGDIVDRSEVQLLTVDSLELRLSGVDLVNDATMRAGLADMWLAESDLAGLPIMAMFPLGEGSGVRDGENWLLAEFTFESATWIVRATVPGDDPTSVVIRADRSNRWDGFGA